MITAEHIEELKHAYQVLGVPLSATSASIKQSYRRLMKRWHPDLYKSGTDEHAEATQMTKLINEAYALIGDAPLRYFVDAFHPTYAAARQAARPVSRPVSRPAPAPNAQTAGEYPKVESVLKFTWLEFWVRLVCGGIFGTMYGFAGGARYYRSPEEFIAGIIIAAIAVALLAVSTGDGFWQWLLGRWWMWR